MVFFICDCVLKGFKLANDIYTQNSFPCKRMQHFSKESERKNKHFILNALDEAEDLSVAVPNV